MKKLDVQISSHEAYPCNLSSGAIRVMSPCSVPINFAAQGRSEQEAQLMLSDLQLHKDMY